MAPCKRGCPLNRLGLVWALLSAWVGWSQKICEWALLQELFSVNNLFSKAKLLSRTFKFWSFRVGAVWCWQVQCRCAQFAALVLGPLVSSTCLLSAGLGSRCWFRSS